LHAAADIVDAGVGQPDRVPVVDHERGVLEVVAHGVGEPAMRIQRHDVDRREPGGVAVG
jgi:hypothetical protein